MTDPTARPLRIVLLGPPASGKGTQGKRLAESLGLGYLSTGAVLREQVENQTELGKTAKPFLDRGQYLPDELMCRIIADWLGKQGVKNTVSMNHGGKVKIPCGHAKMVNAIHSSSLPDGSYGGNPAGFVVESAEGAFYYAGDTALTQDMKQIAEEFDLRFAILPIGDTFTMGATDAAKAAKLCGAAMTIGVHFNTFPPIEINRSSAIETFQNSHQRLLLPAIGETLTL